MKTLALTACLILAPGALQAAGTLSEIQAIPVRVGPLSGVAYYTAEPDGFHLVATLADSTGRPVRFESVLAPGQLTRISVPGPVGQPATAMVFERRDDVLLVTEPSSLTD